MSSTLLIVTDRVDFAADYLIVRLRERGLAYYRLNADQLFESATTFRAGDREGVQRLVTCGDASVDLESVGSVWYRRSLHPRAPATIHPAFRAFAAAEIRHLFEGLICDPAVRWVNPIAATEVAERKVYQLQLAEHHGLHIPATLVSADLKMLENFVNAHESVICKSI